MMPLLDQLSARVREAMTAIGASGDPMVRAAQDEQFGDYQSNCAMGLAKSVGRKPLEIATELVARLQVADMCEPPEIAGPGFINFRLRPDWIAKLLREVSPAPQSGEDRVGLPTHEPRETVVVDLSSPNLAKEMHVGHLRSTVIGDCVARMLEFAGHKVIRENHVGDWGTQFGMLIAHLRRTRPEIIERPGELVIRDLESFYVEAKAMFDADDTFKTEAREAVVALQQGDSATRRIWQAFCAESLRHCHAIYRRLNVRLIDRGESFYADWMDDALRRLEILKSVPGSPVAESEGALCVFLDGFKTREGEPLPLIVRKSDGGANYATSDLATILHRVEVLHADRIVYVVGLPQKQHFDMLFAAARRLGWAPERVRLEHLGFGSMLAKSGRPFKTREGGTVKLAGLLDEAVERARNIVLAAERDEGSGRAPSPEAAERIAEAVGLAAVRYFDLQHALQSDYKFDLDTMLSMEGNTAPYMLYAYARIRSIGRKAGVDRAPAANVAIQLDHPAEIALAKKLAQFAEVFQVASTELRPNALTDYLFELSRVFSRFYDKKLGVRVIDASPESVRASRLCLCDLTARTLKLGLSLLGIETVEQM